MARPTSRSRCQGPGTGSGAALSFWEAVLPSSLLPGFSLFFPLLISFLLFLSPPSHYPSASSTPELPRVETECWGSSPECPRREVLWLTPLTQSTFSSRSWRWRSLASLAGVARQVASLFTESEGTQK